MSNQIDATATTFPVFGVDLAITNPSLTTKLVITGVDVSNSAEKAIFRDGVGDTKARVWYDLGQARTVKLDATVIGADATGAGANNDPTAMGIAIGTTITLSSTTAGAPKYPGIAGQWRVDDITQTGTNTGFASWSISLVPEVS